MTDHDMLAAMYYDEYMNDIDMSHQMTIEEYVIWREYDNNIDVNTQQKIADLLADAYFSLNNDDEDILLDAFCEIDHIGKRFRTIGDVNHWLKVVLGIDKKD